MQEHKIIKLKFRLIGSHSISNWLQKNFAIIYNHIQVEHTALAPSLCTTSFSSSSNSSLAIHAFYSGSDGHSLRFPPFFSA